MPTYGGGGRGLLQMSCESLASYAQVRPPPPSPPPEEEEEDATDADAIARRDAVHAAVDAAFDDDDESAASVARLVFGPGAEAVTAGLSSALITPYGITDLAPPTP